MTVSSGLLRLLALGLSASTATAFSATAAASTSSLQTLLATHQQEIVALKDVASSISKDEAIAPTNDVFYLRYVLDGSYRNEDDRIAALNSNIEWRANDGKDIVTSAHDAIEAATEGETWDNWPVFAAAPHAEVIGAYLTSKQCITTHLPSTDDLVYCIRAGKIDDAGLMSAVSVDQMVDFFLYVKEVNAQAADLRSVQSDSLVKIVTCQDMSGLKLIGGSKDFQKSLSTASKLANGLYPSLNGRTLILNLPKLAGARSLLVS
ncbi:hypothetical protein ACHAXT_013092 [Thalassiosira profunda]